MRVPPLTADQVLEAAGTVGLSLTEADVQSYLGLMKGFVDGYNAVDAMPDNLPSVMYPRTAGRFPTNVGPRLREQNAERRMAAQCTRSANFSAKLFACFNHRPSVGS